MSGQHWHDRSGTGRMSGGERAFVAVAACIEALGVFTLVGGLVTLGRGAHDLLWWWLA